MPKAKANVQEFQTRLQKLYDIVDWVSLLPCTRLDCTEELPKCVPCKTRKLLKDVNAHREHR